MPSRKTRIAILVLFLLFIPLTVIAFLTQSFETRKRAAQQPAAGQTQPSPTPPQAEFVEGEVLVKFAIQPQLDLTPQHRTRQTENPNAPIPLTNIKPESLPAPVRTVQKNFGGKEIKPLFINTPQTQFNKIYKLTFDKGLSVNQVVNTLSGSPDIIYAEPNYIFHTQFLPNDTYLDPDQDGIWSTGAWGQKYEDLWGLQQINADKAWDVTTGSENVIVAVVDTGIYCLHKDLIGKCVEGYDFVFDHPLGIDSSSDGNGHGTHVAGTIAAITNNEVGIAGVAPETRVMPVKALNHNGSGLLEDLTAAIVFAADQGADVINMSWGGFAPAPGFIPKTLKEALDYAYYDKGVVLVAAAGNDNGDANLFAPAKYEPAITVASINYHGQRSNFSNHGQKIDVAAPGGGPNIPPPDFEPRYNILSLKTSSPYFAPENVVDKLTVGQVYGESYLRLAGTSMAAPHVSGLAALVFARHPGITNYEVGMIIKNTAYDLGNPGQDLDFGYGRIDAQQAVLVEDPSVFPHAFITHPKQDDFLRGVVEIHGSVHGPTLTEYTLEYAEGLNPLDADYRIINQSSIPVDNATIFSWDTTQFSDGPGVLRLTASDEIYFPVSVSIPVFLMNGFLPGWPVPIGDGVNIDAGTSYTSALGDIDGDGDVELIVAGEGASVFAWHHDGTIVNRWPITLDKSINAAPTLADLDQDGDLEVVIAAKTSSISRMGRIYIFQADGSELSGWLMEEVAGLWLSSAPAVGDIDGDGDMEIVAGGTSRESRAWEMHAWHLNGQPVAGWPKRGEHSAQTTTPTLADLDGDGDLEVLFGSWTYAFAGSDKDIFYAYQGTGETEPIFEKQLASGKPAAVGDIDGDGLNEIVVSTHTQVHAWRASGEAVPGWPKDLGGLPDGSRVSAPVLGDLDEDGIVEVVVSSSNWESQEAKVHLFNATRNGGNDWSKTIATGIVEVGDLALGDVDSNGDIEIVAVFNPYTALTIRSGTQIYALDGDGGLIKKFPKRTYPLNRVGTVQQISSLLGDIDGNAAIDLVFAAPDGMAYVWLMESPPEAQAGRLEWPMYQRNPQHTGLYPPSVEPTLRAADTPGVYRGGNWLLKHDLTAGIADISFAFGREEEDIPVTGDWDRDDINEPGVFRNGVWHISTTRSNAPFADVAIFPFGQTGDFPLAGDWNGNGQETIGVFRTGAWYLRNFNSEGEAEIVFNFGNPNDIPVVGDWNGDGIDTVGVFRNGTWFLSNKNEEAVAELAFTFGQTGDVPVVGDWDGDGIDTVGVFREGVWHLKNTNETGNADHTIHYGLSIDTPVVGRWE